MDMPVKRLIWIGCVATLLSVASAPFTSPAFGADREKGKEIYMKKCAACHGEKGKGDGPRAKNLKTKPADYTDKQEMAKLTDADMKKTVKEGKKPMPAFGKKVSDEEIDNIIAYIRTLAGK